MSILHQPFKHKSDPLVFLVSTIASKKEGNEPFSSIKNSNRVSDIDFTSIMSCGLTLSKIIIIKSLDNHLTYMLNQSKTRCIIRLTFEAYVDSLSVWEVCGKYIFLKINMLDCLVSLLFITLQSSILQRYFMSMVWETSN